MPAVLAAVVLLGIAGSLGGCEGSDARGASHLARGQHYLAEGKLEKARLEFANALQIAPQNAQARYLMGRVTERLGDPRTAASMYQGAIDADPEHVEARASLARLYLFTSHPEKALELIRPALTRHPDSANLLTVSAVARLRLGDRAGALADAEHAAQLKPSDADAVLALAGAYLEDGQTQRAVALLRAAIARASDSVALRQVLAGIYVAGGDNRLAEEQLLELVGNRPRELTPRLQLAAFYTRTGRLDDAEHILRTAVAALPASEEAKLAYAQFLVSQRSSIQGEAALKALVEQEPANLELQLALGGLEQRIGEAPKAVATYRAIVTRDPRGPKGVAARDRIAAIDVLEGKYAEAKSLIAAALEPNPRDQDALVLRANLSLREGDPVAAIADLRGVLQERPDSVPILRTLARAHLANGAPLLAEESLRSALASAPRDVDVRVDLGQLLSRTHRAREAVTLLEETVRTAPGPDGTAARKALIEAYLAAGDLMTARTAAEDLETMRPELPDGPYLAGVIAERQHRPGDAHRELEHALSLQPSSTEALAAIAWLEFARGQRTEAVARVRSAIERMPGSPDAHNLLGELYLAQQNYVEAIGALNQAVRLAPTWWLPYHNMAQAKLALKDTAGGFAVYTAGVKATGEPTLVVDLAEAYVQQGRIDEAIEQYEILNAKSPNLELAANNLAMLLATYRSDQKSLDRARDLTAGFASSELGPLLDTYGWVRLRQGAVSEAITALERASAKSPDSSVILYHLGMAYLKAGQSDKARSNLEAALATGASFTGSQEAQLALLRLNRRTG